MHDNGENASITETPKQPVLLNQQEKKIPRRAFLKGTAVFAARALLPGGMWNFGRESEAVNLPEQYPNQDQPGWNRILLRHVNVSHSGAADMQPVYKDIETMARPLEQFPQEVIDELKNQLQMSEEQVGPVLEQLLQDFNELRQISAAVAEVLRHDFHQQRIMSPIFYEFSLLNSMIEDRLDGRLDSIGQLNVDQIVMILQKLHTDRTQVGNNSREIEEAQKEASEELGVSIKLGEAEMKKSVDELNWSKNWLEATQELRRLLVNDLPIMGAALSNLEIVADIEDEFRDDITGLANIDEGWLKVQTTPGFLKTFFHESKHHAQLNRMRLFVTGSSDFEPIVEHTSLKKTFLLLQRTLEAAKKIVEMADLVAGNLVATNYLVMREREGLIRRSLLWEIPVLATKLGVQYNGSESDIVLMNANKDQYLSGTGTAYLNHIPELSRLLLGLTKKVSGVDQVGLLNEEEMENLETFMSMAYGQILHFFVEPAMVGNEVTDFDLKLNTPLNQIQGIIQDVLDIRNEIDAYTLEWMSGEQYSAEKINEDKLSIYGATVLRLASTNLPLEHLRWSTRQLIKNLGPDATSDDYAQNVAEYKDKVRPVLGNKTDELWDMYVLKHFHFFYKYAELNYKYYPTEADFMQFLNTFVLQDTLWQYLQFGFEDNVIEELFKNEYFKPEEQDQPLFNELVKNWLKSLGKHQNR